MPRKTKPRIKRRATAAYMDEGPSDNTTAICSNCYDSGEGIETILVTYPKDPIHFLQCPNCNTVVNRNYAKHKSIQGPLGSVEGMSSPSFAVVETRRRSNLRKTGEEPFNPNEFPMCPDGTPDSDLAYYSSQGMVTRIVDDDSPEETFEYGS